MIKTKIIITFLIFFSGVYTAVFELKPIEYTISLQDLLGDAGSKESVYIFHEGLRRWFLFFVILSRNAITKRPDLQLLVVFSSHVNLFFSSLLPCKLLWLVFACSHLCGIFLNYPLFKSQVWLSTKCNQGLLGPLGKTWIHSSIYVVCLLFPQISF